MIQYPREYSQGRFYVWASGIVFVVTRILLYRGSLHQGSVLYILYYITLVGLKNIVNNTEDLICYLKVH